MNRVMNAIGSIGIGAAVMLAGCVAERASSPRETDAEVQRVLATSFSAAAPEWQARLRQDQVQAQCSAARNHPTPDVAQRIVEDQQAMLALPEGELIGDWKAGERIAQSGVGLQFSDAPAVRNGGNCYGCHQLAPSEIAYGTVGPSLYRYRERHGASREVERRTYAKIYDSQAFVACSLMPRFGQQKILDPEQIKDLVALLLDADSPVNQ